jgi:hypothetical protein
MKLDWEGAFRRYVADDRKTPYTTAPDRLTKLQARNELFVYALLLSAFFGVLTVATMSPSLPHGEAIGVPLYCLTAIGAGVALGILKHPAAAAWTATAPVAMLLYFALYGFLPAHGPLAKALLVAVALLWLRYAWRILSITKAWPTLADDPPPEQEP